MKGMEASPGLTSPAATPDRERQYASKSRSGQGLEKSAPPPSQLHHADFTVTIWCHPTCD